MEKVGDFLEGSGFKGEYFLEQTNSTWRGDGDQGQQIQFSDCRRVQRAQKRRARGGQYFGPMSNLLGTELLSRLLCKRLLGTMTRKEIVVCKY